MNAAQFVATLFAARTAAHIAHLGTRSYAAHKALDDFYNEILEVTDTFAETAQGVFGLMKFPEVALPKGDPVKWMTKMREDIKAARSGICKGETMLENIVDEAMGVFAHTLYKLKFLNLSESMDEAGEVEPDADDLASMSKYGKGK